MTRTAIVEDDPRYRDGLEVLLRHSPDFEMIEAFGSGEALLERQRLTLDRGEALPWELVLMDIELPHQSGIVTTRTLKKRSPEVQVVVLTVFESPAVIVEAIASGADGYLLKNASARELLAQLRSVTSGGSPLTAGIARTVLEMVRAQAVAGAGIESPSRLTLSEREQEVLRCFVRGLSYSQTGDHLGIALDTVRNHVRSMYRKLQVHSVAEAVHRAVSEGLI